MVALVDNLWLVCGLFSLRHKDDLFQLFILFPDAPGRQMAGLFRATVASFDLPGFASVGLNETIRIGGCRRQGPPTQGYDAGTPKVGRPDKD